MNIPAVLLIFLTISSQETIIFRNVGLMLKRLPNAFVQTGQTSQEVYLYDEYDLPSQTNENEKCTNEAHE